MLSNIQKNIILRAVRIRLLDDILQSYTKLTYAEREEIKALLGA